MIGFGFSWILSFLSLILSQIVTPHLMHWTEAPYEGHAISEDDIIEIYDLEGFADDFKNDPGYQWGMKHKT